MIQLKPSEKLIELLEFLVSIGVTDKSVLRLIAQEIGNNQEWIEELMNRVKQNPNMNQVEIGILALDIAGWDDVEVEE